MHDTVLISVDQLRTGLHVHLDVGWMDHPFALGQFRIATAEQLQTLRGLGLERVRVSPQRSEPQALRALLEAGVLTPAQAGLPQLFAAAPATLPLVGRSRESADTADISPETSTHSSTDRTDPAERTERTERIPNVDHVESVVNAEHAADAVNAVNAVKAEHTADAEHTAAMRRRVLAAALAAEKACAALAERRYGEVGRALKRSFELALTDGAAAREHCERQVHMLVDRLLGAQDMAIRLLSETAGDRASMHAVNVAVLSLLLGKRLGLGKADLFDLGTGALLHDVGKIELPERVRWIDPLATDTPQHALQFYQEHVSRGVVIGRRMGLQAGAMLVIAQHHELADGSGFPLKLQAERMSPAARIVALVDRYDKLCNPVEPALALTPHEALAQMYGQWRQAFDAAVFAAFIKMMGVYPPGSLVQLTDDRHATVLAVNAARPLQPLVLVHDVRTARHDALPLDLERSAGLGIRRSLKPQQLPRAALEYLSPRPRLAYFFEHARAAYPAQTADSAQTPA